jgi:hypothetical protein
VFLKKGSTTTPWADSIGFEGVFHIKGSTTTPRLDSIGFHFLENLSFFPFLPSF